MGNGRKHWRDRLGAPRTFVLYRTPDVWRYAVSCAHGIADGYLAEPGADSVPGEARTAAHAKAEELAGRPLTIHWEPSGRPGCWTGDITAEPKELTPHSAAG
ncbi:hypothetical protein ACFV5J_19640 [Streptomyces zaomyceticus]|uniref:hypothetical protein n=1 Tax=Streptomyces zaomyceticus TaxID=68286 RepID=UPI00364BFAA1